MVRTSGERFDPVPDGFFVKRPGLFPRRQARPGSALERVVGFLLIALLIALVALIYFSGQRPGPAALAGPAPAASEGPFPLTSPAGWPRGAVERYDVDTVFEKINGKADAYHALGFVELAFASYSRPDQPDLFADAYLYDMEKAVQAYGIFRTQRGRDESTLAAGDEGSASGAAAFARKGRFYLEVIASGPDAADEARALATAIADALPATEVIQDPAYFPQEGLERVTYVLENCLMVEALVDAFVAVYEGGTQVVVARPDDPDAACKEATETLAFLKTPAEFRVIGDRVVGVVRGDAALLEEVSRRMEQTK